MLTDFVAPTE